MLVEVIHVFCEWDGKIFGSLPLLWNDVQRTSDRSAIFKSNGKPVESWITFRLANRTKGIILSQIFSPLHPELSFSQLQQYLDYQSFHYLSCDPFNIYMPVSIVGSGHQVFCHYRYVCCRINLYVTLVVSNLAVQNIPMQVDCARPITSTTLCCIYLLCTFSTFMSPSSILKAHRALVWEELGLDSDIFVPEFFSATAHGFSLGCWLYSGILMSLLSISHVSSLSSIIISSRSLLDARLPASVQVILKSVLGKLTQDLHRTVAWPMWLCLLVHLPGMSRQWAGQTPVVSIENPSNIWLSSQLLICTMCSTIPGLQVE